MERTRQVPLRVVLGVVWAFSVPVASGAQDEPSVAAPERAEQTAPPSVRVEGVTGRLRTNVARTVAQVPRACATASPERDAAWRRRVVAKAESALRALGHFHAKVTARWADDAPCSPLVLTIDPGPPTRWSHVAITIDGPLSDSDAAQAWRATVPLKVGEVVDQGAFDATRDGLLALAQREGFVDARFRRKALIVDRTRNTAEAWLVLESGAPLVIGAIDAPDAPVEASVLRRALPVAPGDRYRLEAVAEAQRSLMSTEWFDRVRVLPDWAARTGDRVPLRIESTPAPRRRYEAALGYFSDIGAQLRGTIAWPLLNRRGHQGEITLLFARETQRLTFDYRVPRRHPKTEFLLWHGEWSRESRLGLTEQTAQVGLSWTRVRDAWTLSVGSDWLRSRTDSGSTVTQSHFWLQHLTVGWQGFDDSLFPTRGFGWQATVRGATRRLLSSDDLMQMHLRGQFAWPFGRTIVRARGEWGTTWGGKLTELPRALRFFAGGDRSVRGYGYQTLAPRDGSGRVLGGQHLVVASVELLHPVGPPGWYGALFFDTGQAFDSWLDFAPASAIGVGARWRSPVGLLQVDLAVPLDGDRRTPRLHLGLGVTF